MSTFYRLLGFLRPYKRGLTASWLLASAAMVMTVLLPYLTGLAVEAIRKGGEHASHHQLSLRAHDRHTLLVLAIVIVGAVIARWALTYMRRMIAGRISLAIEYDLRNLLYGHFQRLELSFFDRQQTGQLMSRATVDLQAVRFFLGYGLVFILQSILTLVLAGVAMILINPKLGLIAMAPVPFVVVISQRYGRSARPAIQEVQQRIAELTADVEENISGVRVVKSFAREPRQLERFRHSVARVFDQAMVATRLEAKYNPMIGFLPQLGLAAVLLIGGRSVIHAHLTLGAVQPVLPVPQHAHRPHALARRDCSASPSARPPPARASSRSSTASRASSSSPARRPLPDGAGHVEFRGVSLRYDESDDFGAAYTGHEEADAGSHATTNGAAPVGLSANGAPPANGNGADAPVRLPRAVLSDIDLDIAAGKTVALVGATGSGKTSLVSLISRLYEASEGRILLDGADIRTVSLASLREAVAFVSDDPFLFSASVAENIAYGRPTATFEEIEQAARRAQAYDFVTESAAGFRHARGRARAVAVGRAAPADRDRARAAGGPARADPRRRDLRGGRVDRAEHQARARRGDGGPHDVRDRAPPVDHLAGR